MEAAKRSDIVRRLRESVSATVGREPGDVPGYDSLDGRVNRLLYHRKMPAPGRPLEPEMVEYFKTPARVVYELIERVRFGPEDFFIDLGSGLGQVVLLAHLLTGVNACGIEIEPAYCEYARCAAAALELTAVEFISSDARVADLSRGTVFFMFTPFKGSVMRMVLDRLRVLGSRRVVRIASYGPCSKEIAVEGWLKPDGQESGDGYGNGDYCLRVFRS